MLGVAPSASQRPKYSYKEDGLAGHLSNLEMIFKRCEEEIQRSNRMSAPNNDNNNSLGLPSNKLAMCRVQPFTNYLLIK
jgi:hypothetical protein